MKVLCDFNLVTIGSGISLSPYIAECEIIFRRAGLKTKIHALGTNIEGDWEKVSEAIGACHKRLHEIGASRLLSSLKIASRIDRDQSIEEKIRAVTEKIRQE